MNIFYAHPAHIYDNHLEITGQEAIHASRVLRHEKGDLITIVDGNGGWYEGKIEAVLPDLIKVSINKKNMNKTPKPRINIAIGIIKKRDRLEFAVEKSVELGASEIMLFRSKHSVTDNVRIDRLESIAVSAMKQSLRSHLPGIRTFESMEELMNTCSNGNILIAYNGNHTGKISEQIDTNVVNSKDDLLLLIGPEGGFADSEIALARDMDALFVSLGGNRLRTETAAITLLSRITQMI